MADTTASSWVTTMLERDKATAFLGIKVTDFGPGQATARMTVKENLCNGHGITHGGFVFTLADTAFAAACNAAGQPTVAAGAQIRFLEPTHIGDELVAHAVERVRRGRNGIYDVTVRCGDEVVAEFRGDSRAIGRKP